MLTITDSSNSKTCSVLFCSQPSSLRG